MNIIKQAPFFLAALLATTGCRKDGVVAPERVFLSADKQELFVADRSNRKLIRLSKQEQQFREDRTFNMDASVSDVLEIDGENIWVLTASPRGTLYKINRQTGETVSLPLQASYPSSMVYQKGANRLWVASRYENRLLEIDPQTGNTCSSIAVGREPADLIFAPGDSLLLVANNLPDGAATDFPVAAGISVVHTGRKCVVKQITLPNGSTDVKEMVLAPDNKVYLTHLLARFQLPTNQVDRGWMSTNALSILSLDSLSYYNTVLLDTPQRGAANPWGITLSDNGKRLAVALSGTHEVAVIDREKLEQRLWDVRNGKKPTPSTRGWDEVCNDAGFLTGIREFYPTGGKGPRSLCMEEEQIHVVNYFSGELVSLNARTGEKSRLELGDELGKTKTGKGEMHFHDATLGFQSWQSCASCHPNDARMDGLNWDLLNDGMGNPKNTKSLLLAHQTAPCMVTGIRKDAYKAVRSGIRYILFSEVDEAIASSIDDYLISLEPVESPHLAGGTLSANAQKGETIFRESCASCHSGPYYTDKQQYEISWGIGSEAGRKMDVPQLNEVWRTAPYLYDGRSYTMEEMLRIHGPEKPLSAADSQALAEYILTL